MMTATRRLIIGVAGLSLFGLALATLYFAADTSQVREPLRLFGLWRLRHVGVFVILTVSGLLLVFYAISRAAMVYAAIIAATSMGFLIILEGAGRAGLIDWSDLLSPVRGELDDLGTTAVPYRAATGKTYQDTATILGLESEAVSFDYRADSHGFRNTQDRDTADIILLGDSILVGALVAADKTISGRLDALLPSSVMQVALIGIGVQEQHQLLRDSGIDIAGRTVVQFVFEGNDLLDSRSYRAPSAKATNSPGRSLVFSTWNLATLATGRSDDPDAFDSCWVDDQLYTFQWTDRSFQNHEIEANYITDALGAFANDVTQKGGRYLLVFVPTKLRVLSDLCIFPEGSRIRDSAEHLTPLREHLSTWANNVGVSLFDLTGPLQVSAHKGAIPWFWGDTHWNEVGHEAAARSLSQWPALIQ
jgi:hypothetical protein